MWTGLLLKQNKTQTSWEINKTGRKSVWLSPAIFWPLNNDFCPPTNQISIIFSLWKSNNQHVTIVGERKIWVPTGFEPMTSQTPGGHSVLWVKANSWRARPYTRFIFHTRRAYCEDQQCRDRAAWWKNESWWILSLVIYSFLWMPLIYLLTFLSNHVFRSSAKIIPVQNSFLNKYIF